MNPIVIDLSHWNPTPSWTQLLAAGTRGIIHKATESTGYRDPTLMQRARPAMDAGLAWATYHFLRPGSMKAQMDWYLYVVDPKEGERMCLDHEDAGVSLQDLEDAVGYLLQVRPDLQVTIYSGNVIKEQLKGKRSQLLSLYSDLWLAQYGPTPSWPVETWPEWALWQYTDKATVSGVSKPVDGNKWNGGLDDLMVWFGPNAPTSSPAPEPLPPELELPADQVVSLALSVPPGVLVEIEINGEVWEASTR